MADTTIQLRKDAERLLSKIEKLEGLFEHAKILENRTEELANAIQIHFMQFWEDAKNTLLKSKFLNVRNSRNNIAHNTDSEKFWSITFPKLEVDFQKVLAKKSEVEKYAEKFSENETKRRFEKFADNERFGDQRVRKKTVNALDDAFKNDVPEDDKSEFPPSSEIISNTVNDISTELKEYIGNHEGLAENIQTDILDWSEKMLTDVDIATNANFEKEKEFIQKLKRTDTDAFFDNIGELESEYKHIDTSDKDFDMQHYGKMLQEDFDKFEKKQKKTETKRYKEAYFQALIKSLTESFNARKATFEQKLIDGKRKRFLKELFEKIENFKRLEWALQPIIDDLGHGYLWDLSNKPFKNLGFDILQKYASLLKNDQALQEFAELLGKQSATSEEVEKQIIEDNVRKLKQLSLEFVFQWVFFF